MLKLVSVVSAILLTSFQVQAEETKPLNHIEASITQSKNIQYDRFAPSGSYYFDAQKEVNASVISGRGHADYAYYDHPGFLRGTGTLRKNTSSDMDLISWTFDFYKDEKFLGMFIKEIDQFPKSDVFIPGKFIFYNASHDLIALGWEDPQGLTIFDPTGNKILAQLKVDNLTISIFDPSAIDQMMVYIVCAYFLDGYSSGSSHQYTYMNPLQYHPENSKNLAPFTRVNGPDHPFPVLKIQDMPFQPPDYSFSFEIPNKWHKFEQFYPEYMLRLDKRKGDDASSILIEVRISVNASEDPFITKEVVHIPDDQFITNRFFYIQKQHSTNVEVLNVAGFEIYHLSFDMNKERWDEEYHFFPIGEVYTFVKGERRYTFYGDTYWGDHDFKDTMKHIINSIQFNE